jgi:hypothetical protein
MDNAAREKLIDRIRKLRAKGENAAVTEAEANTFLDAAARLMEEHAITAQEFELAGIGIDPIEKRGVHTSPHKMHPACVVLDAIGKLTGTHIGLRVTTTTVGGRRTREVGSLLISGRQQDREIADYMFDQVRNLIDGAWKAERSQRLAQIAGMALKAGTTVSFVLSQEETKSYLEMSGYGVSARARRSFGFGMGHRLGKRIEQMAVRHGDSQNALVVWRQNLAVTPRKEPRPLDIDFKSYSQGDAVGKDASLGRGMASGQDAVLEIGHDDVR